jgi:hypothetical protein
MERLCDGIRQFVLDFSKNAFYRSLAYGMIFSILFTLLIGGIEGVFNFNSSFPYIQVIKQAYLVGIVFVSFSFLFAFFGYVSDLRTRDDILTPLRKKLVGIWRVRAQTWQIENGQIENGYSVTFCTIAIEDIGRKLVMHFKIQNSDVFKDQEFDVTAITLGYQGQPRQLIYFHESELTLKDPIGSGVEELTKLKFPFLGVLDVLVKDGVVKAMEGRWYDIDNSMYNLARRIPDLKGFGELRACLKRLLHAGWLHDSRHHLQLVW